MKASGHFPPLAAPRDTALFPTTSVCTQQAQGQRRNCSRCAGIKGQIAGSAYGVLYKSPMDPPPPPLPFPPITSVPLSRWTRGLSSGAFRGCQLSVTRQTWHSLPWTFFFLRNPFQRQPLSQTSLSPRLTVGSPPQADWTSPGASPCPCRVRGLPAGRSARATARASEPGNPESARGCTTVPRIPPRCFSRGAGCRWKKNEDLNSAQFFLSFISADVCILRQEIRLVSEMHPV